MITPSRTLVLFISAVLLSGCSSKQADTPAPEEISVSSEVQAISLLGDTLRAPALDSATRVRLEANLQQAESALANSPENADSLIWYGRRLAYLGQYKEAIAAFSKGAELHAQDARMLRHRGHRYLTVRNIDAAIEDFTSAAALENGKPDVIEPDGAPNAANIPLSTTQFNIWYHLALAHYLKGDWQSALNAWDECIKVSTNPDLLVASSYWRYLTLRRMGRDDEAKATVAFAADSMTLLENDGYLDLIRLFRGDLGVADVLPVTPQGQMDVANSTTAYGVSMWHSLEGRAAEAEELWKRIVDGGQWPAFGSLAAEAELANRKVLD